jgi:hypothetical protein
VIGIEALADQWTSATIALAHLTEQRFVHQQQAVAARRACEEAKAAVLLQYAEDPKALGANEATRDAKIKELCGEQYAAAQALDTEGLRIDHELALTRIRIEEMKFYRDLLDIESRAATVRAVTA